MSMIQIPEQVAQELGVLHMQLALANRRIAEQDAEINRLRGFTPVEGDPAPPPVEGEAEPVPAGDGPTGGGDAPPGP